MTNAGIALSLERIAALLERQLAPHERVRAWRQAALDVRALPEQIAAVVRARGRVGLIALPGIGVRFSTPVFDLVTTETCSLLDRLEGRADDRIAKVPGIGPMLAERIHEELGVEELEELERAAQDGRLSLVGGMGPRRVAAVQAAVCAMLGYGSRSDAATLARRPTLDTVLQLDRRFRDAAREQRLPLLPASRLNPEAVCPVLHCAIDGRDFTVMYSNSDLARRRNRMHDWVIVLCSDEQGAAAQLMVVTELHGLSRGRRVVRGFEYECAHMPSATVGVGANRAERSRLLP